MKIDDWDEIEPATKKTIKHLFGPETQYNVTTLEDLKYLEQRDINMRLSDIKINEVAKEAINVAAQKARSMCATNPIRESKHQRKSNALSSLQQRLARTQEYVQNYHDKNISTETKNPYTVTL